MKKTKILLMVTGAMFVMAGCGKSTKTLSTDDSTKVAENHDPVTINLQVMAAYQDVFHAYVDPIIGTKYPYITLNYITSGALSDEVTAGEVPDIIQPNGSLQPELDLGLQYDMSPLVKTHKFDLKTIDQNLLGSVRAYSPNGELYALPSDRSVRVLLYNKDIFDKFSVPYPTNGMSWQDIIQLSKRLNRTDGGNTYHGLYLGNSSVMRSEMQLHFFDKNGKAQLMTPDWMTVAQTWKELNDIPGNFVGGNERDHFSKNKDTAMIITNSSWLLRNPIPDLNWDYVVSPTFDNHLIMDKLGAMLEIPSTSKNKDAAFDVISLYFSDEVQTKIARSAGLVVGSDVESVKKQYGADVASSSGKNLQADFSGNAAIKVVEKYGSVAGPIVDAAFKDIATGKTDINTALRQAQYNVDQAMEQAKTQ